MEIFDKVGKGVGDVLAKARERERVRLEDRLRLLDRVAAAARELVSLRKHRPGYSWMMESDSSGMEMIAAAEAVDDEELTAAADSLMATKSPYEGPTPDEDLETRYRTLAKQLGRVRRETLSDD